MHTSRLARRRHATVAEMRGDWPPLGLVLSGFGVGILLGSVLLVGMLLPG